MNNAKILAQADAAIANVVGDLWQSTPDINQHLQACVDKIWRPEYISGLSATGFCNPAHELDKAKEMEALSAHINFHRPISMSTAIHAAEAVWSVLEKELQESGLHVSGV